MKLYLKFLLALAIVFACFWTFNHIDPWLAFALFLFGFIPYFYIVVKSIISQIKNKTE